MSRRVHLFGAVTLLSATIAALTVGAGGASAGSAAVAAAPGPSAVTLIKCSQGKKASKRSATFRGEMTQIPAAERMRMRFDLQERIGKGKWTGVDSPALRVWRESSPGVTRFAYRQKIEKLNEAASYRTIVRFQWLDASGRTVAKARARSKVCRQRGKLPNLAFAGDIRVGPGPTPETFSYAVRVANNGLVASPRIELALRVNGSEVDVRKVGKLEPGRKRTIRFVGPDCRTVAEAQIDPRNLVREISEADNQIAVPCESALASAS